MSERAITCIGGPLDGQEVADSVTPDGYSRITWCHALRTPNCDDFYIHDSLTAEEVKQRIETLWGLA